MDNLARLSSTIGKEVRIDRGGPESRTGRLLAVKQDHLVVHNAEEGVVYYKTDHIKSLTLNAKNYSDIMPQPEYVKPEYLDYPTFVEVAANMKHRWVQINRGGPEKIEGILHDVLDDHIVLQNNHELIFVFNFHVRNISYVMKQQNQDDQQDQQQVQQNNNENKKDKKSKDKDKNKDKDKK